MFGVETHNVQEERVQEVKDGILETWGVWLF